MNILPRLLVLCVGLSLCVQPAEARHHNHTLPAAQEDNDVPAPEPPPLPAESAPKVDPAAPPSASLGPFVDTHVGKILAPLGESAFVQTEIVAGLQAAYNAGLAYASPDHKPAYNQALAVCNALVNAMTERQNAVTNLRGALATRSTEAQQPRGGGEAVANARAKDAFFLSSQKSNWITRASELRKNIAVLYLRERQAETQVGAWSLPVMPDTTAAVSSTPLPAAQAPGADPVVGGWVWPNHGPVKLEANHSINGTRHGTWLYTRTTDAGRNYEMHWAHKGWVDYMVLSGDGKTLDGKRHDGVQVTANR